MNEFIEGMRHTAEGTWNSEYIQHYACALLIKKIREKIF
jgi:hypothetical protein